MRKFIDKNKLIELLVNEIDILQRLLFKTEDKNAYDKLHSGIIAKQKELKEIIKL